MKKKITATILCLALAMTMLAGCGSSSSKTSEVEESIVAEVEVEPEETKKPEVEETEEPVMEEAKETEEEVAEPETAAEESKSEEATESEEKPAETQTTTETTKVETPVAEAEAEVAQTETAQPVETTSGYVIDKYISDGSFVGDYDAYVKEMGGIDTFASAKSWNVDFRFGLWTVALGTSAQDPMYAYVGILVPGEADLTYCCLFDYTVSTDNITIFSDGSFVPREAMYRLEDTINYMKSSGGDPNQKPSIPGMNWIGWDEANSIAGE